MNAQEAVWQHQDELERRRQLEYALTRLKEAISTADLLYSKGLLTTGQRLALPQADDVSLIRNALSLDEPKRKWEPIQPKDYPDLSKEDPFDIRG